LINPLSTKYALQWAETQACKKRTSTEKVYITYPLPNLFAFGKETCKLTDTVFHLCIKFMVF